MTFLRMEIVTIAQKILSLANDPKYFFQSELRQSALTHSARSARRREAVNFFPMGDAARVQVANLCFRVV